MAHRENRLEANMDTRIAVIGMSAILPCGTTVRESWEAIRDGIDCLSDLPEDRVDVTAYFDPVKTTKDKIYCKRGGFIPEYDFDAREFGLNMFQMEDSDANQTVTLLKVKEALEDAGIEALSKEKKNIGCVLGIGGGQKSSHEFYSRLNYVVVEKVLRKMGMPEEDVQAAVEKYKANFPEWRLDSFPGFLGNVTAGRCTNTFNLDGMNCVVDAACASSLIAVKVAIDELLHGDCDMMITGATCTDNSIGMYMAFSKTPVFSTDPSVRAYDEKTKGMLIGEGSAMLVLKRYADAVRDGDEIHAVIRGCASSSDGKASGIYTPTISGQEEALRRAYMRANVDPATVTLVEGHGTGTPVGDRIELTALRNLFDSAYGNEKEKVAVGSIKSNIGHLKAVAGLAGMIKVIMALKHKTLPATINVDEPPKLYDNTPITDSSLYINTMNRPWFPAPGVPRRAGISSFGFGGANYHAVLEEAEPEHQKAYRLNKRPQPVLLMASSTQALASLCEAQLKEFEKAIEENKTVKNTAYIKCVDFCEKFKFPGSIPSSNARLGFLVKEADDATETLRAIVAQFQKSAGKDSWHLPRQGVSFRAQGINTTGGVAALFSGQGAQYTHMFSEVAMNWPQFRESISDMDRAQAKVAGADKDYERVSQVLYPRKPYNSEPEQDHKKISLTSYSQPSTLACALGAYEIFKQAGFKPDFAAGHSLGEFAALYAADCVNRDDLFELVCRRARIMGGKDAPATPKGCMAAVIGPNAEKIQIRTADVWLGNCNSPSQTVITGSVEGIKKESELLQSEGFRVVPLACESAFHSPQMQNASSAFKDVLSKVAFRQPSAQTKLFSNVSGETYSNNAQDLLKEHMTSSVKFISQVRNMHSAGARIFVEFGPKQVLSKLVSETLKDDPSIITISVNPSSGKDADIQLREAAVQLVVAGVNLQGFDKWDAPDATRLQPIKKKKTTLRLSAATYVSDKTKKAREAAMNDGRMLSCVSKVIAPPAAKPIVDTKAQEEVARLQKQLQDAQAQIQKAKADAAEADKKLAAAKDEAKRAAASAPVQKQVDTTIVDKHRAILKSMLAELDCYSTPGAVSSSFQAPVAAAPAPVAAPVAAAPAPAVNNALLAKAESVVMEVLAAKTGYETDMIEPDMELETELGIDSIKRVEILSEVQAQLNVEAKDVDALSRTRTVGEVVNAMKAEIAGSSGAAAAAPAPVAAAPAPVAAAAPAANSALLAKAETVVMEVLAAKTGYETDMIEPDMELETELGIDSIKRVEILSEVQAQLNVEAKDVDALSRTRTVGEVVNAMKAEIAGSSGAAAAAPAPVAAAPAPVAAAAPAVSSALLEKAESVVMEVLAAKTGYETDMIEADMELETELGIDSIKRVEILSEVQAQLNVEAKDVDALSRTRTVGEVVNAMKAEIAGSSGAAAAAPAPVAAAPAPVAAAAPAVSSALLEKAESVVMEVLAAKTGYETDMIEADMELETELGIDSIKRVEILSEVQAMLNVEAKDVDALSRTRTVGEVVNAMKAEIAGSSGAATASAPAAAAAAPAIKISTVHGADCDDLSVMSAELVDIRRADELLLERPENRPVLIVDDGTELTSALVRVLGASAVVLTFDGLQLAQRAGAAVRHVQVKDLSAESAEKAIKEAEQRFGQLGGFISQQAERFAPADILGFTLMCAKFAKASLCTPVQGGRAFFIGVARLDGRLGFTSQGSTDSLTRAQRGAIFGLCKTIGLEWSANEVFARGIDIAREVHPEDAAVAITREMSCADNRIREVGIGLNQKRCTIRAVDLKPGAPKIQISQDDVLLVSGGARGITPLCIREITRQVRGGKYILLGRSKVPAGEPAWCNGVSDDDLGKAAMQELKRAFSAGEGPKPTPMTHKKLVGTIAGAREVRSSIANIEALGGKAIYSSCDVNSAADVAKAVREAEAQLGARVTGVVHASGVLRDRLIEQKRPDEFDAVFGTKVTGLENLFGAIDMANLKHLVLFSSLAGFHGNIGQSDYAMANEALNKMGLELSDRVSVKSICFGPWDGGMVTPQLKKQFQSMGVQIIPREGGADTVARIVLGSSPAEILVGNWTTPTKKVGSEPVVIHRKISAASNPFLKDHVIQGRCVLPMTIAVGCLAETCLGQFPGYSLWAIEDAQLFKGVTVDGDVNCEITLKPSQGTAGRVMIQATLKTFASGKLVPAYRAVIVLSTQGKPPAATTSQTPSLQADPAARGNPYDGKTLFHGPAFQGLKEIISCNKSQLVAECTFIPSSESAGEFASDYESHNPFVNDIAFQAMLVWIRRTLGQAALPNSIQRIVQHRALPQDKPFYLTLKSNSASGHSQHKTSVQFHNEQGDLFVDIQASVTSSDSLAF